MDRDWPARRLHVCDYFQICVFLFLKQLLLLPSFFFRSHMLLGSHSSWITGTTDCASIIVKDNLLGSFLE